MARDEESGSFFQPGQGRRPPAQRRGPQSDQGLTALGRVLVTIRVLAGIGSFAALVLITFATASSVSDGIDAGASAIQVIQLYTEGLFWSIVAIGVAVTVYVATRWKI